MDLAKSPLSFNECFSIYKVMSVMPNETWIYTAGGEPILIGSLKNMKIVIEAIIL